MLNLDIYNGNRVQQQAIKLQLKPGLNKLSTNHLVCAYNVFGSLVIFCHVLLRDVMGLFHR